MQKIKVVGVGGAGGNIVNRMIQNSDSFVAEYVVVNTDTESLEKSSADQKVMIVSEPEKEQSAVSNFEKGAALAEMFSAQINSAIDGADLVFITAGLGGCMGSGASAVLARIARDKGVTTVAVVSEPLMFEGKKRAEAAREAGKKLRETADVVIALPGDSLMQMAGEDAAMSDFLENLNDTIGLIIRGTSISLGNSR